MSSDPWPEEPDEPNPESRWGDPEPDPESDVPAAPSPAIDESDVDPQLLETFWRSVILANVAVFGFALGPMLVYFRGQWLFGAAAVAGGAVAGLRVYQHYRAFEERRDEESNDGRERNA